VDNEERWGRLFAQASAERSLQPQRICELCVEMLAVTGACISMVTPTGNRGVVCATDDVAARIEDMQLTYGEGPCVDAVSSGRPVMVPNLTAPENVTVERWPAFMEAAEEAGVKAVFAFPLRIGAINVGALDLYRDRVGALDDGQLPVALMAADAAAIALLHLDSDRGYSFIDDVGVRSSYELEVHQATGMVQEQAGVSTEDAFLMLRARAFADGRSMVDVATSVVARRIRFSAEDT
jgi:GAF domain-containing protein